MNIKEAAEKFGLDEKEVTNRKKDDMILGVRTVKRRVIIPDDTVIIPSKQEIQAFLFQILKYKNNPNVTISREFCPDENSLHAIVDYIFKRGFIGEYQFFASIRELFKGLSLTDEGLAYVIGEARLNRVTINSSCTLAINPEFKFGVINT